MSKCVQSRGWVINGISLEGVTNSSLVSGKRKTQGWKAWETVPATRYECGSGRLGTAGVLVAQSHVGITCYPVKKCSNWKITVKDNFIELKDKIARFHTRFPGGAFERLSSWMTIISKESI